MQKLDVTVAFVEQYLSGLCSTGRKIPSRALSAFKSGEALVADLNPAGYTCPIDFMVDYQAIRLLKKYPALGGVSSEKRRSLAIEKFLDCEVSCSNVNVRMCNVLTALPLDIYQKLCRARDFIASVLGGFTWDVALGYCDFGPGASIGVPRRTSHLAFKIGCLKPTVTGECLALAMSFMDWAPMMKGYTREFKIVPGSKITTVPKDARIDRVIAIEPLWNMFFQKGIGGLIRHKLRKIGLDLDKQAPLNQELARYGSLYGTLATVDLSSASDSISLELCRFLLPPSWFDAMMLCRSHRADIDGKEVFLKKISSMGNGFTFELESLIFLALTVASSRCRLSVNVDVAVFGDDIICPPEVASDLQPVLDWLGFKVNPSKSFLTGPFRESCGKHYFDGYDVTPFHLRKEITSINEVYWAANQTREFASRLGADVYCSSLVREAHALLVRSLAPRLRRNLIPRGSGDDGLIGSFDEATPKSKLCSWGTPSFIVSCFGPKAVTRVHDDSVGLLVKLYCYDHRSIQESDALSRVTTEAIRYRYGQKRRWWHQQWPWLGAWL